jgi:hypothetical protein
MEDKVSVRIKKIQNALGIQSWRKFFANSSEAAAVESFLAIRVAVREFNDEMFEQFIDELQKSK